MITDKQLRSLQLLSNEIERLIQQLDHARDEMLVNYYHAVITHHEKCMDRLLIPHIKTLLQNTGVTLNQSHRYEHD